LTRYGNPSKRYDSRPPLYYVSGKDDSDKKLIIQYARRLFTGYKSLPRSTDIPPLTEAQAEAIDAIHYKAEEYALTLDFCEGDIQLVNNLALLHGRTGFKDSPTQTYVAQKSNRGTGWQPRDIGGTDESTGVIFSGSGCATPNMAGQHLNLYKRHGLACTGI